MKRTTLEELFDAVNHKATFFANMLRTQKLSVPYQNLKTAYVKSSQEAIKDYVETMMDAYQRLTTGTQVCPRKIAMLAACLAAYKEFKPFQEIAGAAVNNNMDMLLFLLTFDLHQVNKRATVVVGIPVLLLDKLVTLLKALPEEHQRIKIMKLALGHMDMAAGKF